MKLNELASPTNQVAKVFESYFGSRIKFDDISYGQARAMLNKVRTLVQEHRRQPAFYTSEKNPAYLKLVMLEQGLTKKVKEDIPVAVDPAATDKAINAIKDPKMKTAMQKSNKGQNLSPDEQKMVAGAALAGQNESRRARSIYNVLRESEIQQAQVVLAAQDMVDRVQKMLEDVTALQFKDLPALVDQVKNEVGVDQAMQFNTDTTAALSGLVQNLQASKLQLESAVGVITGQAPQVPGDPLGGAELPQPDELGAEPGMDAGMDAELDADIDMPVAPPTGLGRGRR